MLDPPLFLRIESVRGSQLLVCSLQAGWDEEDPETGKKKPKYKTIQQKYEELPGMEEGQWDGIKRMPRWTREPRCCYAIAPKGFRKERYPLYAESAA